MVVGSGDIDGVVECCVMMVGSEDTDGVVECCDSGDDDIKEAAQDTTFETILDPGIVNGKNDGLELSSLFFEILGSSHENQKEGGSMNGVK
mmetsp:Transcript_2788/g.3674  ORF Transcript_2788/g.3674 Transcript_2788/m.3674 type:complete len:91 (-) Transcript_2788:182-454(-)